jgi:hypothetical protein
MKLSEAIRLGAMLKPQAHFGFRRMVTRRVDGWRGYLLHRTVTEIGTCALGSALDAVSKLNDASSFSHIWMQWPWTYDFEVDMPQAVPQWACLNGSRRVDIVNAIYALNDVSCWTREQIADWVETIERERELSCEVISESIAVTV